MKNPLVSIITIVYNNEDTISRTIESVLAQTYKNIEYVVVDGGSNDGTVQKIQKYNISKFISEKDRGISDAFNKGILLSSGELIGMINSGDYYETTAVESIVNEFLRINEGEGYKVFHGNIRMFKDNFSKIYQPLKIESFTYQMPVWHPTIFVSREVYKEFLYNLDYKIAMDYELFSKVYGKNADFIYINKLISNMDIDGISNTQASKGFKEVMYASRKNLNVSVAISFLYYRYKTILNKVVSIIKK